MAVVTAAPRCVTGVALVDEGLLPVVLEDMDEGLMMKNLKEMKFQGNVVKQHRG
jgi:hypothetical protein